MDLSIVPEHSFCVLRGLGQRPNKHETGGFRVNGIRLFFVKWVPLCIACQFLVPVRNPSEAVVFDAAYSVTLRLARGRLTVSASAPRHTRTARHGTLPLRERP